MPGAPLARVRAAAREPFRRRRDSPNVSDDRTTPAPDATLARRALADERLAIRCQLGEPGAFDALVDRWHPPLCAYVARLGADDAAADLVQDVWLRVLRALPRLRDPARFAPWLFGIARRAAIDRLRRRYAEPPSVPLDDDAAASAGDDPDDADDGASAEALAAMHDELARLPLVEREALALFYLRELTIEQLADVLAVPPGTVKSRLHRARRRLRANLDARGVTP